MGPHARTGPRRRDASTRRGRSLAVGGRALTSMALVAAVVATTSTASASAPEDVARPLGAEAPVSATLALPVPADAALDDTSAPGWSGFLGDAAEGTSAPAGLAGLTGSALTPATLRTGALPPRVRAAYVAAADRLAEDQPACGLPWWLLAGVGQVESGHAAGGRVRDDGVTLTPVRGPRLDGTLAGTAVVRDSDRGSLDGDAAYDRAVGPMQFMPGTWSSFGTDGDGDGRTNPDDVDDAALAAGRYLCDGTTGGALAEQGGQAAALFRYNRSISYGLEVIRWGIGFRDGTAVPPAPQAPSPAPPSPAPPSPAPPSPAPPSPAPSSDDGGAPAPTGGPGPAASPDGEPAPAAPPASPPAEAGGTSPTTEASSDPSPDPSTDPAPSELPGEQLPSEVPAPDPSAASSGPPTLPVCAPPEAPATDGPSPTAPEPTTAPTTAPASTPSDPPSPADPSGASDLTAATGEPSVDCLPPCRTEEDATPSVTSDASGSPSSTEVSSGETEPAASPSPTDMDDPTDDPTDAPTLCAPPPPPPPSAEPEPATPSSSSPTPTGR